MTAESPWYFNALTPQTKSKLIYIFLIHKKEILSIEHIQVIVWGNHILMYTVFIIY